MVFMAATHRLNIAVERMETEIKPITLPSHDPFFLLAYDSAECQEVK